MTNTSLEPKDIYVSPLEDKIICWFCKIDPAEDRYDYPVVIHNPFSQNNTELEESHKYEFVTIPCCKNCKRLYRNRNVCIILGSVLGIIIGFMTALMICFGKRSDNACFLGLLILSLLTFVGYFLGLLLGIQISHKQNSQILEAKEFPGLKVMLKNGWKLGRMPPGI